MDLRDEAGGSVEPDDFLTSDQNPKQPVEPDEVVDMRMRNEDVLEPLDPARRQIGQVAEVEEDRAPLEQGFDIERRIAGSPIDQEWVQKRPHGTAL